MDHKEFLATLSPAERSELTSRSNSAGLRHLASHAGAAILGAVLIGSGIPCWWLLLPVQGILLIFLFTLEHEATHQTPFASPALNDAVGRVCGLILVLPFTWFRYFHLAHHRFTHDPDRDPELLAGPKPEGWRAYAWHVSGLPYWGGMLAQFARLVAGRGLADFVPPGAHGRVVFEARAMALIYGVALGSLSFSPLLWWIWILPVILGQPFLRLFLLAEHGRCPHVANMFDNTRTTFTCRAARWLAWNVPYHAEHHVMPAVPFHKLTQLHRLTRAHLLQTENGYARFHRRYVADFAAPDNSARN